jgi:hypothetical protein
MKKVKNQSVTKMESNYNVLFTTVRNSKEILNYRNFKFVKISSPKYPEMVEIIRSVSSFKNTVGKRFINVERVKIFIETLLSNKLIDDGKFKYQNN